MNLTVTVTNGDGVVLETLNIRQDGDDFEGACQVGNLLRVEYNCDPFDHELRREPLEKPDHLLHLAATHVMTYGGKALKIKP